ncbi:hypothetical protein C8J57DRAFT_332083 [Mycena rebaudengoi]|nr:hypothetical protein C8J57DRAFT_332083 [Mycena rebaudengoi]
MSPPSFSPPSPSILNSTSVASPTFPSPRPGPTQAPLSSLPFVSTIPPPLTVASPAHRTITSSTVARPSFARRSDLASTSASSSSSSSAPLPPVSTGTPAQPTRKHRREEDDNDDRPELEPVRRRTSPASSAPVPAMDPPQVPAPKAKAKGKLGIKHLDLLYEARGKTMHVHAHFPQWQRGRSCWGMCRRSMRMHARRWRRSVRGRSWSSCIGSRLREGYHIVSPATYNCCISWKSLYLRIYLLSAFNFFTEHFTVATVSCRDS